MSDWKKIEGLYAFWSYDSYPFVLGGAVKEIDNRGRVKVEGYGTGVFEPMKIMPSPLGAPLHRQLEHLRTNEREARKAFEEEWRQKAVDVFGPELSKDAMLAHKMRRCEEYFYCTQCDSRATGPCPTVGHISQHLEPKGGGRWGASGRKPVIRNRDGTLTDFETPIETKR